MVLLCAGMNLLKEIFSHKKAETPAKESNSLRKITFDNRKKGNYGCVYGLYFQGTETKAGDEVIVEGKGWFNNDWDADGYFGNESSPINRIRYNLTPEVKSMIDYDRSGVTILPEVEMFSETGKSSFPLKDVRRINL